MKDSWFIRGNIPMTKSEVRAVSLDKLEISRDSIVYDIGAGTGSVSVEAALRAEAGHVYAFEQKEEGVCLIRENGKRAGVENLTVIPGRAPETMEGLPGPDRVFIGGSGGNLQKILDRVYQKNPQAQVVINVIALETLVQVMEYYKGRKPEPEVVCIQTAKAQLRAGYHMMQGTNPVYVITAEPEQKDAFLSERDGLKETDRCEKDRNHPRPLPRLMLAAPASGSGKTVLTAGLLALFQKRGLSCVSFKCGPDYIDPMFHRYVLGIPGCNLDSFFSGKDQIIQMMMQKGKTADLAVIEGVMGYYDGVGANTVAASSYDIARITDTPVILVVDGKGSSLSVAAVIKGIKEYRSDSRIAGVILNRTSPAMASRLKKSLEEIGVPCLGAVPEWDVCRLESRHLGLTLPQEQAGLNRQLEELAEKLAEVLDIEAILKIAGAAPMPAGQTPENEIQIQRNDQEKPVRKRRMAVALDQAFCFYYQENLDFLQENGWELAYFSPLTDGTLPEETEAVLIGGGYPEVWARQLSENQSMLCAIRQAAERGVKFLAECGGFLYLHQNLEGTDGVSYPMAGLIGGDGYRTDKLSRFGYLALFGNQEQECQIRGHEFHYWDSTAPGASMTARKPGSDRQWPCMTVTDTLMAGFPHLYYRSGPQWILNFLKGEHT